MATCTFLLIHSSLTFGTNVSCWQCMCNGTLWHICVLYHLIYPVPDTISFEESAL